MEEVKITKRFSRKLSINYNTWDFSTEITRTVKVSSKEDMVKQSDILFNMTKALTEMDIAKTAEEMKPKSSQPGASASNLERKA